MRVAQVSRTLFVAGRGFHEPSLRGCACESAEGSTSGQIREFTFAATTVAERSPPPFHNGGCRRRETFLNLEFPDGFRLGRSVRARDGRGNDRPEGRLDVRAGFCFEKCETGPTVMIGGEHIHHCTAAKAIEEINERIDSDGPNHDSAEQKHTGDD